MPLYLYILPKDVQKIVWKNVFDNTMTDLYKRTKYIRTNFDLVGLRGYSVKVLEKTRYYTYFRYTDNDWGLLLGSGKYMVSNKESIDNFLYRN
jgi:hypothetical protein